MTLSDRLGVFQPNKCSESKQTFWAAPSSNSAAETDTVIGHQGFDFKYFITKALRKLESKI